jgi:SAM-dependent methyltransferase
VLRGGDAGATRLRLLAAVMWPTTRTLLRRVGLRRGMRCLDVGCGTGLVTRKMARCVGPGGKVVGVDVDARCIELAQATNAKHHLHFRAGSVFELPETGVYDLVYSRFLLGHLSNPAAACQRLLQVARPGGVIAVEDVDFTGHFCFPACPAFERYVALYGQVVAARGGDANIGPRLRSLLTDSGLQILGMTVAQPAYATGAGKRIAPVTMEHVREAVVAANLATNAEVDTIVSELNTFVANPRTIVSLPRIFQVWGQKPA